MYVYVWTWDKSGMDIKIWKSLVYIKHLKPKDWPRDPSGSSSLVTTLPYLPVSNFLSFACTYHKPWIWWRSFSAGIPTLSSISRFPLILRPSVTSHRSYSSMLPLYSELTYLTTLFFNRPYVSPFALFLRNRDFMIKTRSQNKILKIEFYKLVVFHLLNSIQFSPIFFIQPSLIIFTLWQSFLAN